MRKIKNLFWTIVLTITFMLLAELFILAFRGVFTGMLVHLFYPMFKALFAQELIIDIVLFVVIAAILYGGFNLSKKQENKVWSVVSIAASIIGFLLMFS